MRYLTTTAYESVLMHALRAEGLPELVARRLIAARHPMGAAGICGEAFGRGLIVRPADVLAVAREKLGPGIDPEEVVFAADAVEEILAALVESGRAELTSVGKTFQANDDWVRRKYCDQKPAADAASMN